VAASAGLSSTASGGTEQMIALLAICRKVIILDLKQTDALQTLRARYRRHRDQVAASAWTLEGAALRRYQRP
jgi:orotidine-5'-phosphate decarboxylase